MERFMILKRGEGDFDKVYRPGNFDEVVGQIVAKDIIRNALEKDVVSRAYLFYGPPGTGKTTIARLIALGLNCEGAETSPTATPCGKCQACQEILHDSSPDYLEINVGNKSSVNDIRQLDHGLGYSGLTLKKRVIILDEIHRLSTEGQQALLKPVEKKRDHVYFIFCTTETRKLDDALLQRCSRLEFRQLIRPELIKLMNSICEFEGVVPDNTALELIAEERMSARDCVITLQDVLTAEKMNDLDWLKIYLNKLTKEEEAELIELAKIMMRGQWNPTAAKLKILMKKYPEETIRRMVANWYASCLLGAKNHLAAEKYHTMLKPLTTPLYSNKPRPELIDMLFESIKGVKKLNSQ